MGLGKFIKTSMFEYLKENNSLDDIDISKLLNKFISDPVEFMKIFNINTTHGLLSTETTMKLSLFAAKFKIGLTNNWLEIHKNLTANIDGMDVSKHLRELIYPNDVPNLINDTDNFLKKLENRVKQRKNTALKQEDFSNPYGRAYQRITPLDVVTDAIKNPNTKFNYTQFEYAQADLDLQLITLIKSGNLEVKTSNMKSSDEFNNEMLDILKNGLKGEELINLINISDLRKFVEKFWKKNKKAIEDKYNDMKNKDLDHILIQTIDYLKK